MKAKARILIVDDERVARESVAAWLKEDGHQTSTASSGAEALALAEREPFDIYFVDLKMPGMDGLETMRRIRALQPDACVVIITAYATVDTAVEAMKEGAADYITKPTPLPEISLQVERLLHLRELEMENRLLRRRLSGQVTFHDIVGKSPAMQTLFALIRDIASVRSTVLIEGESGTGKEMVARALHFAGNRADKPFIAVACAALTDTLFESELFGHERGAFTGATERRKGKFELADGGTLFLDEVGDISARHQAELLRALQERSFFRVGGSEELKVDVRVVAATNRPLEDQVREGTFREDLYYRLNVVTMRIPPLRDRREDIPLLVHHLLHRIAAEQGRTPKEVSTEALHLLVEHSWPGNVRELENALERATVTSGATVLRPEDFAFLLGSPLTDADWKPPEGLSLRDIERQSIVATLARAGGNVSRTASELGIDRSTLYEKMKRYGITRPESP